MIESATLIEFGRLLIRTESRAERGIVITNGTESGRMMRSRLISSETLLHAENASKRVAAIKSRFVLMETKVRITCWIYEGDIGILATVIIEGEIGGMVGFFFWNSVY